MFEVPDWETDVPKTDVVFKKKATNKKFKNESAVSNPIYDFVKNPQCTTQSNTKVTVKDGSVSPKKKKPKKHKLNNVGEDDMSMKESEGFEFDELLVNAKIKKANVIDIKDGCEELGEDTEPKKIKGNWPKLGKIDGAPSAIKRKHNDDQEISRITVKAKKIKLDDKNTEENGLKNKKDNSKKQKLNKRNIEARKDINGNNNKNKLDNENKVHTSSANMAVSAVKHINKDTKKKEKLKKLLEHRTPIKVTGNKLRERMLDRLKAAQFRYLNEKLYTSSGNEAQKIFQADPEAFRTYHLGYQIQVKKWPVNPLDVIVKKIQKMPKTYDIADMGCGEAALSKRVPNTVHSFDLVASAPGVVECDMARTPLLRESMDVVVYCLALMGTELTQYLVEANRVLKTGGQLLIAEVESRFDDVTSFIKEVERLGFKIKNLDKQHSVFLFMHFIKVKEPPVKKAKLPVLSLKPCIYKRR